ncbi:MAG TPA: phosphate/phosphite/phosphonate ABC transporter substrate-binding protein [Halomicronema sp.]
MKRRNLLFYSFLFLVGCTAGNSNKNKPFSQSVTTKPEKLRVSITEVKGIDELERDYGALRSSLGEILEQKIEFFPVQNYLAAVVALQSNQVDLVLTGPSEYVVIRSRTNATPVIGISRPNYYSLMCVRADSNIKSVGELKGKKIAMWDVGSTSGHLSPIKFLIEAGLDPKSDVKVEMMRSKGLSALNKGEIDAWGGSAVKYEKFIKENNLTEKDLPVLIKGPDLPNDLFVAGSQLNLEFVEELRQRLLNNQTKLIDSLSAVEEGKFIGSKLEPAQDSDYDMIREVYKAIGQGDFID